MNDTETVQAIIDATADGGTAELPAGAHFMIDALTSIKLKSNMTLLLNGATLEALPNSQPIYSVVNVTDCSNVTTQGPGTIKGERYAHTGQGGEFGHGILIERCHDITIRNLTTKDCWGDGICADHPQAGPAIINPQSNITIENIISESNRRQGISVVCCIGLRIRNSTFRNIGGTAPGDGIDLEAEPRKMIIDAIVEGNTFENTQGSSVGIGDPGGTYRNIIVRNNVFDRKSQPIWYNCAAGHLQIPLWALGLKAVLSWWSGYRWWGYPTELTIP